MNGGKITFSGPPVDEVSPQDIADALEMFAYTYLQCPLAGPYREDDDSILGVNFTCTRLLGQELNPDYELWVAELRDILAA